VSLDARLTGEALRATAGDLVRVWRSARRALGQGAPPGALDGVMEEFLERVAEALLAGAPTSAVWSRTGGVVRLPAGPGGAALAEAEWRLVEGVLESAGRALGVADGVAAEVRGAVEAAIAALPVDGPGRPAQVLVVRLLPAVRPPSRRGAGPR
jgi:hypothetical protein